jgi:mannose/fructose/N-acetylgalactosamine-specific phosphotransferase system component IID
VICAVRAAASVCPALKRLHECETVDRYRALPREPSLPQARSTSATLVAAVADGMGQRATQSSQMAARAPPESAEA